MLSAAPTERKNLALEAMGKKLHTRRDEILRANEADLVAAGRDGLKQNLIDRLRFGEGKIQSRIDSLGRIAALPDPVGELYARRTLSNGLRAARMRVPLGVILMIYEARPHVTVNAGAFCVKSGNAAILRGGWEAKNCNALLGRLWAESLAEANLPQTAVQVIWGAHSDVDELLGMSDYIDLVIPRGGRGLIESVSAKSKIPVIKHYAGVCHVYLDDCADVDMGIRVALDSKCLMPEVCNAMETLLVSDKLTGELGRIVQAFRDAGVEVRGCERTGEAVEGVETADEADWSTEYLDKIVSVRVVEGLEAAIEHINHYGSGHTDSIITGDEHRAKKFVQAVDSGVVLVNASTMFCDGATLGMGAEIGISTDKIHARGPMGLEELTSYKFVIRGDGQVMGGEG